MNTSGLIPGLLLALIALAGCAGGSPPVPEGLGGYVALEAWRGETHLDLKYMGPDGLVYSRADWLDELVTDFEPPDTVSLFVVNPSETGRDPWQLSGEQSRRPIPVLHASEYQRLRNGILSAMVPRGGREAVEVELGNQTVALYFDVNGRFQSVTEELPPHIRIVEHYSLEEYLEAAPAAIELLLNDLGISSREVIFNTGDTDEDSLPFLYANLDTRVGGYIRVRSLSAGPRSEATLIPMTQSVSHLLRSHTTSLINRPVSSVSRLMFAVTDAARDNLAISQLLTFSEGPIPPVTDGPSMDLVAWEQELDRIIGRPALMGTMEYFIDGEAYFTRLEEALDDSRDSVLLRTYLFDNDDYAMRIADRLRSRGAAGVQVKVLTDGFGTMSATATPPRELPEGYRQPISVHRYLEDQSLVAVRQLPNPFFAGDHTKTTIVDERLAFIGGMNIGREYRYEWHDLMVEVHGPVVAQLADDFDVAWAGAGPMGDVGEFFTRLKPGRDPGPDMGHPIRVIYTSPTASEIRRAQIAAIRQSRRFIYLENAYFTDDTVLNELIKARRRGVDVRVVIPLESNRGPLTRDNILTANAMFQNGIRVYIYPGMSHVKAAVFDGWACLGSANMDHLSLRVNRETNIATSDPEAVQALVEQLFLADFKASPEMQAVFPERWNDRLWEMVGDYAF